MVVGVVAAVLMYLSLRRARLARLLKVLLVVATYLVVYAAAERWGPVLPLLAIALVLAAVRLVDIRRYPDFDCGACDGAGKFRSGVSTALRDCGACGGRGRQERRGRKILAALGITG